MKLISSSRRRCAVCKTRLIPVDGSLVCPDWTCAQSPAATLNSVRTMPPVAPGYVPATHVLPASSSRAPGRLSRRGRTRHRVRRLPLPTGSCRPARPTYSPHSCSGDCHHSHHHDRVARGRACCHRVPARRTTCLCQRAAVL